jgi:RNA polymerase sigma-70 factor, ECF subfamily
VLATLMPDEAEAGGLLALMLLHDARRLALAFGPEAALPLVAALEGDGQLAGYHLLPATRADLLRRLGRSSEAAHAYREALELASTDAERRFLARRLAETSI